MYWRDRLACFGARSRGTCTNRLTISRQEVEERVLAALRDKLMRRDLFENFCRDHVRELNRLRMEHRASLSNGRRELASVEREIRKFIQAIKDGVPALSIKDELLSLEARKAELGRVSTHQRCRSCCTPRMADVYREKVGSLCLALESEESRTGAVEAIRALIEAIRLEPDGDKLKITLKGDLAGMLSAARQQEVARYRRPLGPNKAGCGGVQPAVPAAVEGGCVTPQQALIRSPVVHRGIPPAPES